MVNTFITELGYAASAKNLDYKRLGKQRVEAAQIINGISRMYIVAEFLGLHIPYMVGKSIIEPKYRIAETYVAAVQDYLHIVDSYRKFMKLEGVIEICDDRLFIYVDDELIDKVDMSITQKAFCGLLTETSTRRITTGFVSHVAALSWIGYEQSLMRYTNAHINEWVNQGYNNTMARYIIDVSYRPWWVGPDVIRSHKTSLYRKDSTYYKRFKTDISDFTEEYIWPARLSVDEIVDML